MAKFRYRTFKIQRKKEREERERASIRADKDFEAGNTRNPYRGVNQNLAWKSRMKELVAG